MHAVQLGLARPRLTARETELLILLPEPLKRANRVARLLRATSPVLADPGRSTFRDYGLGRRFLFIQRSGSALVDREGGLAYVRRSTSPRDALDLTALMAAVEALPAP